MIVRETFVVSVNSFKGDRDMSKKFTFVGGTTRGTKIDWPVEVRAFAIAAKRQQGLSAKEAFAAALVRLNEIREAKGEAAIVDLPKSYTGKYAGSLMYGVEQRFLKQLKGVMRSTRRGPKRSTWKSRSSRRRTLSSH